MPVNNNHDILANQLKAGFYRQLFPNPFQYNLFAQIVYPITADLLTALYQIKRSQYGPRLIIEKPYQALLVNQQLPAFQKRIKAQLNRYQIVIPKKNQLLYQSINQNRVDELTSNFKYFCTHQSLDQCQAIVDQIQTYLPINNFNTHPIGYFYRRLSPNSNAKYHYHVNLYGFDGIEFFTDWANAVYENCL